MIADGQLDTVATETKPAKYRWRYVTINGAEHLGPKLYSTRAKAKAAGREWLAEHGRTVQ